MRVTLVNTNLIHPPVAPIAFDYLDEPLRAAGFEPDVLDLCFSDDWPAAVAAHAAARRPSCWGVTLRNTDDTYFANGASFLPLVREMVATIRRHSAAPIVLGGVGFSVMPESLLELCAADYGITCEGEVAFPQLLRALADGARVDDVPGLVWRAGGEVRRNPPAFADLVAVGTHRRALVDAPRYFATGGQAGIETKRGCNRACAYCVEPLAKGARVRLRAPAHVADEFEALLARGVDAFHINDSEFNLDVEHAHAVCAELTRRGLGDRLRWYAYGMPHPFPEPLARAMRAAGCAGMNFGVDSASDPMLRAIRRSFRRRHIVDAVAVCKRVRLPYMLELLIGFPGETRETVRDSLALLREIDAELVSVTVGVRVFPRTQLAAIVRTEGLSAANPNLHGAVDDNDDLTRPIFYVAAALGPDPVGFVRDEIGDDARFFTANSADLNYNSNQLLCRAIADGARGAYWAILAGRDELRGGRPR